MITVSAENLLYIFQEILTLAKKEIQEYIDKYYKRKKRNNQGDKSPSDKKSKSQIIRGKTFH